MGNEIENKVSSGIANAIESRIQHPFIGTLVFSFLIFNFDVIYKLAISSKESIFGIKLFMQAFQLEPTRYWYPFIVALFVALLADSILFNSRRIIESYINNLTNRYIERSNKISLENRINTLESSIGHLSDENSKLRAFINSFTPALIEKINTKMPELILTFGNTILQNGDLVAIEDRKGFVNLLNKGNSKNFCGIIHEKITENIFLIINKFDETVLTESLISQGNQSQNILAWDPTKRRISLVGMMNDSLVQLGYLQDRNISGPTYFKRLNKTDLASFSDTLLEIVVKGNYSDLDKLINQIKNKEK